MADPGPAQSGHGRTNPDPERPAGIAHRSDHADLDRRDRRRIRRAGLQRRGGGHLSGRYLQGEYFWFNVERKAIAPVRRACKFQGGYAEAAYVLTGETRKYNPGSASYGGIVPAHPFSLDGGGWGAWEIAGRVSTIDLNDQLGTRQRRRRWTTEHLHGWR